VELLTANPLRAVGINEKRNGAIVTTHCAQSHVRDASRREAARKFVGCSITKREVLSRLCEIGKCDDPAEMDRLINRLISDITE
jgi:hypothetical protein